MPRTNAEPARILIADDQEVFRTGIATVLSRRRKYVICGLANDERQAIELAEKTRPQLLVLNLFLGKRDGITLVKNLRARFPQIRLLVISDRDVETFADRALRAGAFGYLTKSASARQLLEAIEQVLRGEIYITPRHRLLSQHAACKLTTGVSPSLKELTDRELHVFQLIGVGLGTTSIARELGLSRKTIESYKEQIKNKLNFPDARVLALGAQNWLSRATEFPRHSFEANPAKTRGKSPMPDHVRSGSLHVNSKAS